MIDPFSELSDLHKFRREIAMRDLEKVYDVTIELFKWGATTALALNGAALVVLIGMPEFRSLIAGGPGISFGIGTLAAFGAGVAIILGLTKLGDELLKALWEGTSLNADTFELFAPSVGSYKWGTRAHILLICAMLAFLVGCLWTGLCLDTNAVDKPQSKIERKP